MVEAVFQFSGVADGELCSNSEGSINFQALRAGASESGIVGKNDASAVLADPTVFGHRVHGMELPADNTIGTTKFFLGHVSDSQPAGLRRRHGTIKSAVEVECSMSYVESRNSGVPTRR